MASNNNDHVDNSSSDSSTNAAMETMPLMDNTPSPLSRVSLGKMCFGAVVVSLALSWFILDTWTRDMVKQLFSLSTVSYNLRTGAIKADPFFQFPLTLACLQFAFMAVFFFVAWKASTGAPVSDLAKLKLRDQRWGVLMTTHVFSTFWLQSLMMPGQMMSLGLFAASRAVEIPTAAVVRSQVMGTKLNKGTGITAGLMFAAAWMIFYSYSQIAECLCIWSGHGVSLTGAPLFFIYFLVLTLPAIHTVFQEAVMVQLDTDPCLLLCIQNFLAVLLCIPILLFCHIAGWEDVGMAMTTIVSSTEVYMLVLWLCVQMSLFAVAGIALIAFVGSFWAVAMRCGKVVYWWCAELFFFFIFSHQSLSIYRPNASVWSFVMFTGAAIAAIAITNDQGAQIHVEPQFPEKSMPLAGFAAGKEV